MYGLSSLRGETRDERWCRRRWRSRRDLAGVLLNDAVADGEAEAGAAALAGLGRGLGGEEGIVDALEMCSGAMPAPESDDDGFDVAVEGGDAQRCRPFRHGVLGVEQQVEKTCCSLPGLPWMRGSRVEFEFDVICAVLN
jgi:hypothetical protein